jgi:hypothetical protein
MNTASRLYDESPYDGIAHEVCLRNVWQCDTLLKLLDPVRYAAKVERLKQQRAEWQAAADRKLYQLIAPSGYIDGLERK